MSFEETRIRWLSLMNRGARIFERGGRYSIDIAQAEDLIRIARFCQVLNQSLQAKLKRKYVVDDLTILNNEDITHNNNLLSITGFCDMLYNHQKEIPVSSSDALVIRDLSNLMVKGKMVTFPRIKHAFIKELLNRLICELDIDVDEMVIRHHCFNEHCYMYVLNYRYLIMVSSDAQEYVMSGHADIAVIDTDGIVSNYHHRNNLAKHGVRYPHFLFLECIEFSQTPTTCRVSIEQSNMDPFPYTWCILEPRTKKNTSVVKIAPIPIHDGYVNVQGRVVTCRRWLNLLKHFQLNSGDFVNEKRNNFVKAC